MNSYLKNYANEHKFTNKKLFECQILSFFSSKDEPGLGRDISTQVVGIRYQAFQKLALKCNKAFHEWVLRTLWYVFSNTEIDRQEDRQKDGQADGTC